jgi:DNA polymerase III epsilon subunit-like protein
MAKKQYFLIIDTETTNDNQVFDFGAIVVDRQGNIVQSCAIIVKDNIGKELFQDPTGKSIWSKDYATQKKNNYMDMLEKGNRMMASVNAINRWLEKVNAKYTPIMTAYNVAFDQTKCANTGIDLTIFNSSFCLWHLACQMFAAKKDYKNFIAQNHYFNNPTEKGNMGYKTNAEVMAHYITGRKNDEPHTALEDAQYFELPILLACIKKRDWKDNIGKAYNWRDYQVKDHFIAK